MKKLMVIFMAAIFCNLGVFSQNSKTEVQPKLKISNVNASLGSSNIYYQSTDFKDFSNIVDNADNFFDEDITQYKQQSNNIGNASSFHINLGLTPFSKKTNNYKKNREIQIGFTLNSGYRRGFGFNQHDRFTIDTITFHGKKINADSVMHKSLYYDEFVNDISLSLAYLFKTETSRKLGAYIGLSTDLGFSFLSEVEKSKHIYNYVCFKVEDRPEPIYIQDSSPDYINHNSSTEQIDNSMFIRMWLPVGLSYKLSKKENFLGMISIFTQGKFGFEHHSIGNKYTYLNALLGINGGLKCHIG